MTTVRPEPPIGRDDAATELFDDVAGTVVTVPAPDRHAAEPRDDDLLVISDDEQPGETGAIESSSPRGPTTTGRSGEGPEAVVDVDRRMRERWVAARRAEGRRRLVVLVSIVVVLSVVGVAYAVARSSLLGMDTVDVRGARGTPAAVIRDAAAIAPGAPLLFLDTPAIERRVEALPLVARASVETELPGTVVIRVTERVPLAWVAVPGGIAVLDRDGRVLSRPTSPPEGLAEVAGLGAVGAPGTTVRDAAPLRALGRFPPALALLAQRVEVDGADTVVRVRGDGAGAASIRFGSLTGLGRKVQAALAIYADLVARGQRVSEIDVSAPAAPFTR